MATVPFGSVEYLYVPVRVTAGDAPTNPSVQVAIVGERDRPNGTGWVTAEWTTDGIRYLLDGTQPAGKYGVWVRLTDAPETPIRRAGTLVVT